MTTGIEEAAFSASRRPGERTKVTNHRTPLSAQAVGVTKRQSFARTPMLRAVVWASAIVLIALPAEAAGKLVLVPDPTKLIILLVFFVLLVFPLNAMIFRPLFRVLDDRESKISGATNDAQQLVTKASELMEEYRGKIREAREDAEASRRVQLESARSEQASITGDAKAEAEDEIGRAREEIGESLNEARTIIQAASREVAGVAAERILGRPLR